VANLKIPERYQAGVAEIRKLDDESVQEIRAALDRFIARKDDSTQEKAASEVAISAVTSISKKNLVDFKPLGAALAALYGVKSSRDIPTDEFVEQVCDAMESLESPELRLPHAERDDFRQKLMMLLNADVFSLVAKISDLRTDDERTFCSARILTDLRPAFGARVEDGPKAMVIVHLLKLGYHQGGEKHQEFYVSLDAEDLDRLKKIIERAETKAKTLKSVIKDVRVYGAGSEE